MYVRGNTFYFTLFLNRESTYLHTRESNRLKRNLQSGMGCMVYIITSIGVACHECDVGEKGGAKGESIERESDGGWELLMGEK